MTQQGPNVVELYEAAVQQMLPTLGAVTADQLTNATPCVEWNVQNVIIHNIKVADYVQGIIQGNNTTNPWRWATLCLPKGLGKPSSRAQAGYWSCSNPATAVYRIGRPGFDQP